MEQLKSLIELYLNEKIAIAQSFPIEDCLKLADWVCQTYAKDGTVYVFANGGPAGAAEGFATDLKIHPFVSSDKSKSRQIRRLRVICLNESSAVLTGVSNDLGYENVFSEQLKNYLRENNANCNDLVIGFSGSGNSANVLKAFEFAKQHGVKTACVSGRGGGKAKNIADLNVVIPGKSNFPGQTGGNDNNFHIEDFQVSVTHMITGLLKKYVEENHNERA